MIFSKEARRRLLDLEISVKANLQTTFNIAEQINKSIARLNDKVFPLIEYDQNKLKIVPPNPAPCVTIRCQCGTEFQAATLKEASRGFRFHARAHRKKPF